MTAVVAALVLVSRFAYLANGPWEWDETLFARGILHFELAAHFPHPPGFPGWLAIGHLVTLVVGDPLRALQLASAAFSVAALWLLSALGRRVAPPPVAVAAALVVLAAPGPWLYSVRGFSTTAATVLALGAAVLAVGGLEGRRATGFTLLVSASVLVKPHLLPSLGVLWVAGVWRVRPLSRLLPGVFAGIATGALSVVMMVWAEGGWSAFLEPFIAHSGRHFSRLVDNLGGYPDLGLVKGFGGVPTATLLFGAAVFGLLVWWRRVGRSSAVVWAVVLVLAAAQLVWIQNRTYCRYAVGVQMAVAPLVAGAAATASPAVAVGGLLVVAGWLGAGSLPLVEEQHRTELPGWRAVVDARGEALRDGRTVVLESELYPFASYLWHLEERRGHPNPPWVLSPWDPEPWSGIAQRWVVATVHRHFYPAPIYGRESRYGGVSESLEPLTQQRFLEAWVIEDPLLPVEGWWPAEQSPGGRRYMWGGAEAELLLPPMAEGSVLRLAVAPAEGVQRLWVEEEGSATEGHEIGAGGEILEFRVDASGADRVASVLFRGEGVPVAGGGDPRALSVQLREVVARDPGRSWTAPVTRPWWREIAGINVEGAYGPEIFDGTEGMWLAPHAVLRVPVSTGEMRLQMWAPRPTPPSTVLSVNGEAVIGPLDIRQAPAWFSFVLTPEMAASGLVELVVSSEPYAPSVDGHQDSRSLGVVLSAVAFEPPGRRP